MRSDLEREMARPVTADELVSALVRLAETGLVDAYVYDPSIRNYRKDSLGAIAPSELWFLINSTGRAEYERLVV
jgi:hypothetical protein